MRSLGEAAKARRHAHSLKTEQLFADAGQDEQDYRDGADGPSAAPKNPLAKRDLRDVLDRRNPRR